MVLNLELRFIAFGVGLDPRQAELSGPVLGPLLVGLALGITSFASAGLVPGYTGAAMNPARCFAFAVARGGFKGLWLLHRLVLDIKLTLRLDQWIWWTGPLAGSLVHIFVYRTAPPYHSRPRN